MKLFIYYMFKILFLERGREGEREGEKHQCVRETSVGCLSSTPGLGTKPATQALALTWNRTGDISFCRMMPDTLRHSGQGSNDLFLYSDLHALFIH